MAYRIEEIVPNINN